MSQRVNKITASSLVNAISQNYYFMENKYIWDEISRVILAKKNIEISELDRMLGSMGDVHLRVFDMEIPYKMRMCSLEQEGGVLFYLEGDSRYQVLRIGRYTIEKIIKEYSKYYKTFPEQVIINQIIRDFQFILCLDIVKQLRL